MNRLSNHGLVFKYHPKLCMSGLKQVGSAAIRNCATPLATKEVEITDYD